MTHAGFRRPLALGLAVFGAGAMLAASSALAWPSIKNYLSAPAVASDPVPQGPAPVVARNPAAPGVSGFVAATRDAGATSAPEGLVRVSIETVFEVDTLVTEAPRLPESDLTARDPVSDGQYETTPPPVAETPPVIEDQTPVAESGDTYYIDPTPRSQRAVDTGPTASFEMMRGGPETLRSHRQMGTFR